MSYSDIVQVLSTLISSDNDSRRQAEEYLVSQMNSNLAELLSNFLAVIGAQNEDLMIRSLAGILLRRTIDPCSPSGTLIDDNMTNQLRIELMNIWANETNPIILRRMSHVIAQSASNGKWVDLIPSVVSHSSVITDSNGMLPVLNIIEIIADYCPDDILTHVQCLIVFLGAQLSSQDSSVQIAAAKATGACIVTLEDDSARSAFKPAVQPMICVLGNALNNGDEIDATAIMEHLVCIAQLQPMFFKGTLDDVVSAMLSVASATGLEFSTRSMALELMVTLTETAPALARRCGGLLGGLVPLAMSLMLDVEVEDDNEWVQEEYNEEEGMVDENCAVGEEAIERAASGMGGRVVGPAVVEAVQEFAGRENPIYRRAAVAALSRLAEGSTALFKTNYLDTAYTFLTQMLQDSSPRVQFQSVQAVGRLAELYPASVGTLIELYMTPLTELLAASDSCDRIKGHAASALINICRPREDEHTEEDTSAHQLSPEYLDSLLSCLVENLQTASIQIQPICLTLLGCVAQVSAEGFAPYYPSFMPGVKAIVQNATGAQFLSLRGKAMECVGLIGEAVGDDVFEPDALEVMQILLTAMGDCDDDITFDSILPACARISHALGDKFEPFLPLVMEPLLRGAQKVIQFSLEDAEDGDAEGEVVRDEESGLESAVISLGAGVKKRVTLNTHAMQQKNQCARMLYEFAAALKGSLNTYLCHCFNCALAMVTDKHSSDIRSSASLAVPKLFEACIDSTQRGAMSQAQLGDAMMAALQKLVEAIAGEVNATARVCAVEALRDTLVACFESGQELPDGTRQDFLCFPDKQTSTAIIKGILGCCQESVQRRAEKESAFASNEGLEEEDEAAYAGELEEEEDVLSTLVDAMGQLLKLHGPTLMPFFDDSVAPKFSPFMSTAQPQALQVVAVCMLDDIIEFGGVASHKYIPSSLDTFLGNLSSDHPVLRQSSAYGIAQCLRFAPELCLDHLPDIVSALVQLATCDVAREEENEGTTENALFGLGLACMNPALRNTGTWGNVAVSDVAALWLRSLPFRADENEAKLASAMLCDAIEANDAAVMGEDFGGLPELLRVIAEVLSSTAHALAHPTTLDRMRHILLQLQNGSIIPSENLQCAYDMLPADLQQVLSA